VVFYRLTRQDTFLIDYLVLDVEGQVLWLDMHARILRDSEGNPERLAIQWLTKKMEKHDLNVIFNDERQEMKPLDKNIRTTLVQCIRELLFNVVKHANTNEAEVTLTYPDNYLNATVKDHGNGFDVNNIKQDLSKDGGFGLFSIRERIELLSGRMNIDSAPGKGAEISLMVPLKGANMAEGWESQSKVNESRQARASIKILLVDDHEMMREGLKRIIDGEDDIRVVAEAADGKNIMALVHDSRPDVIIMDVNLPGRNGIELTKEIKSELSDIHVVGLSLYDDEEVAQNMRDAGAAAYLTKTEAFETLSSTIRSVGGS
jgi:CheY-like chemotaxis protein